MLQSACVAKCVCCKVDMLHSAHVVKCTCCKVQNIALYTLHLPQCLVRFTSYTLHKFLKPLFK